MALKYPIGVQSFAMLREDGYAYVDKTSFIEKLVTEGKYYCKTVRDSRYALKR